MPVLLLIWSIAFNPNGIASHTHTTDFVDHSKCEVLGKAAVNALSTEPRVSARFACIDIEGETFASGSRG